MGITPTIKIEEPYNYLRLLKKLKTPKVDLYIHMNP